MKTVTGGEGYTDLIASFEHEVVFEESDNDYQGSTFVLLKDGDRYGLLSFGWGSCSWCDALDACDRDQAAVESLRDGLYKDIEWHLSPEDVKAEVEKWPEDSWGDGQKAFKRAVAEWKP